MQPPHLSPPTGLEAIRAMESLAAAQRVVRTQRGAGGMSADFILLLLLDAPSGTSWEPAARARVTQVTARDGANNLHFRRGRGSNTQPHQLQLCAQGHDAGRCSTPGALDTHSHLECSARNSPSPITCSSGGVGTLGAPPAGLQVFMSSDGRWMGRRCTQPSDNTKVLRTRSGVAPGDATASSSATTCSQGRAGS